MKPRMPYSHEVSTSAPRWSRSSVGTSPDSPSVAIQAKASMTPPNWASTPLAAVTTRRSSPRGAAVDDRVGDHGAHGRADERGHPGQQHAVDQGVPDVGVAELADVGERRCAVVGAERLHDDDDGRHDQEDRHEGEERQGARARRPPSALPVQPISFCQLAFR